MSIRKTIASLVVAFGFALPAFAQDIPPAPDLVRPGLYQSNVISVVLDGTLEEVSAFMEATPITDYLEPTDAIPAIEGIVVLEGEWGDVGAIRRVDLAEGYHVHERVLTNEIDEFTYQIWDITAPAGRFISHIHGEILLFEVAEGTQITWSYNIKPRYFFTRPSIRSYLNNDFLPFMQGGLYGLAEAYMQSNG